MNSKRRQETGDPCGTVTETGRVIPDGRRGMRAARKPKRSRIKERRLWAFFLNRALLAKNLLGSLFYVIEDFSGYRVLVLLTTVLRNKAIIG